MARTPRSSAITNNALLQHERRTSHTRQRFFRGQRIVVTVSLRHDMKRKLHGSHLGAESFLRRAWETIFWPSMNAEVKELIASCETCRKYETSSQKESLRPHGGLSRPWEQIEVDLLELNKKKVMVTVDYCSNFWEVDCLTSTTSAAIILKLKTIRHGMVALSA